MTDDEIIDMAKRLGWNVEHAQTNRMLILFTRAVAVELIGQQNKALLDSALLSPNPNGLKYFVQPHGAVGDAAVHRGGVGAAGETK